MMLRPKQRRLLAGNMTCQYHRCGINVDFVVVLPVYVRAEKRAAELHPCEAPPGGIAAPPAFEEADDPEKDGSHENAENEDGGCDAVFNLLCEGHRACSVPRFQLHAR